MLPDEMSGGGLMRGTRILLVLVLSLCLGDFTTWVKRAAFPPCVCAYRPAEQMPLHWRDIVH